ncbi:ATP-dependent exodnase (exonuclease V) alpha subunit - helicase superfamily I member [Rufibacter radiotolerans]|uniref:ATP-dependent exodnase (Exonuclease V) alpha subunit-helicase superfamily I member n=2 Tax=Rufibacter radiotolerans TaxID=1379910 RepID=A0A0H4W2E1_9BACT|nr:ATP-dependent exodnase (exonuclease V) alpha subunit - helicase superfamily I member [Rufibacter radiotolerans]
MRVKYQLLLLIPLLGMVLSAFAIKDTMRTVKNESFGTGEVLQYKVHYGVINAGEATIQVAPGLHRINNRPTFQTSVSGKTTGSFDFFHRVRDTWTSYIDTASLLPLRFHRNIEEGNYRRKETTDFDHIGNKVVVNDSRKNHKNVTHKVPDNVQDMVSGFYYLRALNLDDFRTGQTIRLQGFLGDEIFDMNITYRGVVTVDTKAGKIKAHRLVPRMPSNKLFDGEDAITVYLSDDVNKVPVMFEAKMFVGSVKVDLYKYSGLQGKLNVVR